jgi:hypothetical protein
VVAQSPSDAQVAGQDQAMRARHEVLVMERVLEQKVQFGAQRLNERFRAAGLPDVGLLTGAARARGTRLEGYGVFFDLEVPAVRESILWSLQMMGRPDPMLSDVLGALRNLERTISDPAMKASLDAALQQLETRVGPPAGLLAGVGTPPGGGAVSALAAVPAGQARREVLDDPAEVYTSEVRAAVVDAMLDHSGSMNLAVDEWFTVAARDDLDPRFLSGDPNDIPRTMIIRVRGGDLTAFRAGRLTREEAVQRVEVSGF